MSKGSLTLPNEIVRVAIFDDIHENVEMRINELCLEYGLKKDEIKFETLRRYADKDGNIYTYAVIKYWKNEFKGNPAE